MKQKSVPGGVLGIIGTVFGFIGGLGLVACAACFDAVSSALAGATANLTVFAIIFGFGGAILGLIGAIFDFSKPVVGGILQLAAFVFSLLVCILITWNWASIIAFILFLIGGILSFAIRKNV